MMVVTAEKVGPKVVSILGLDPRRGCVWTGSKAEAVASVHQ